MANDEMIMTPEEFRHFFINCTTTKYKEKLVFGTRKKGLHCTIHLGTCSGYFDMHLTGESLNVHRTLFKMRHFTLMRVCIHLNRIMLWAMHKYFFNMINIGKLKRHDCIAIPVDVRDEEKHASLFKMKKNDRYVKLRKEIPLSSLADSILEPDGIPDHSSSVFNIYSSKGDSLQYQGFVFKIASNPTSRKLHWVSKKNYSQFNKVISAALINVLHRLEFDHKRAVMKKLIRNFREKYSVPKTR